jgi:type I restriction enzyme S subunit
VASDYAIVPTVITLDKVDKRDSSLSPSDYCILDIRNPNTIPLGKLVSLPVKGGKEIGSKEYISKSTHFFVRTKCLSSASFLLDFESDGVVPIRPQAFKEQNLSVGDILISKDSNIGETVILNQTLANFMVSAGIRILKIRENPYYVFAILKNRFFTQQLELLTSRGATLKHARTKYLDCKIPFPNQSNSAEIIEYVSLLVRAILRKEAKIAENSNRINDMIKNELIENQSSNAFTYLLPRLNQIEEAKRLDGAKIGRAHV